MKYIHVMLMLLLFGLSTGRAQQDEVSITILASPVYIESLNVALTDYRTQASATDVQVIPFSQAEEEALNPLEDPAGYLDTMHSIASRADIILVDRYIYGMEATRTGFFLDIRPLINSTSPTFDETVYTSLQEAFAWDNGLWAFPAFTGLTAVTYNPTVFDDNGLAYPQPGWTSDDYVRTAEQLATENVPGMFIGSLDIPLWFQTLSSEPLTVTDIDGTSLRLNTPPLNELLTRWSGLARENVITTTFSPDSPLQFGRIINAPGDTAYELLPGERFGLDVSGFAISAGTPVPEQAFDLITFLVRSETMADNLPGAIPAYAPLAASGPARNFSRPTIDNGVVPSPAGIYLRNAWQQILTEPDNLEAALVAAEMDATDIFSLATERQGDRPVIQRGTSEQTVTGDAVQLNFGVVLSSVNFTNRQAWQQVMDDFGSSQQPPVEINLIDYPPTADGISRRETIYTDTDCFFAWQNYAGRSLALDVLLQADPDFDRDDLLPGVLESIQRGGETWEIPVSVSPLVMYANEDMFARVGLTIPDDVATIDAFTTSLQQLNELRPDQPAFFPYRPVPHLHLLLLMGAYGAQPIDYSTYPPTLNFTESETLDAMQQVLDLVKAGYISYDIPTAAISLDRPPALLAASMTAGDPPVVTYSNDSYRPLMFPVGRNVTPVIPGIVSGVHISESTRSPEVCYRLAQEIVRHPDIYTGIPAYQSVIDAPATEAIRGLEAVMMYQQFADRLASDNRLIAWELSTEFPDIQAWLQRAFLRYVTEDASLQAEMAEAARFTEAYIACELRTDENDLPFPGYPLCALEVDPTILSIIQP